MSELKFCQGPECHMHKTKDRIKGTQGNKTYQTRRRSSFYYGKGNFCSTWCQAQWFDKYGDQAINHFGRVTTAKHLTQDNAWGKQIDWNSDYNNRQYISRNGITNEQRPITEEQYEDNNYTVKTS